MRCTNHLYFTVNVRTLKESSDKQRVGNDKKKRKGGPLSPNRKPFDSGNQILVSTIWLGARENFYRDVEGKKKRNEKKSKRKS